MGIVMAGAGLAGANAAMALREQGYEGDMAVLSAESHEPYERPPLSKGVLLGHDPEEVVFLQDSSWWQEHGIDLRLGVSLTGIDRAARQALTSAGPLGYEHLVLATGSAPRHLAWVDEAAFNSIQLRTLEDSRAIKQQLTPGARIALIGAGWIGLEVAAAARAQGAEVVAFDPAPVPLMAALGPEVGQLFADLHRAHGVELRLGTTANADDLVGADLVLVGIGAVPNSAVAEAAGLAVDNGVLVDATLRSTDPRVWAIGDLANHDHPRYGRLRVEHWDNAIEQGKHVAANIVRALAGGGPEAYTGDPYFFSDQYDLGMEYVGNPGRAGYDRVDIVGDTDVANGGAFRAFWVRGGEVVAAMQANDWDFSEELRTVIGTRR